MLVQTDASWFEYFILKYSSHSLTDYCHISNQCRCRRCRLCICVCLYLVDMLDKKQKKKKKSKHCQWTGNLQVDNWKSLINKVRNRYRALTRARVLRLHRNTLMYEMDIKFLAAPFHSNFLRHKHTFRQPRRVKDRNVLNMQCTCAYAYVFGLSLSHYIIWKLHKFNILNDNLHAHDYTVVSDWT